jgi:hypothetical protein
MADQQLELGPACAAESQGDRPTDRDPKLEFEEDRTSDGERTSDQRRDPLAASAESPGADEIFEFEIPVLLNRVSALPSEDSDLDNYDMSMQDRHISERPHINLCPVR